MLDTESFLLGIAAGGGGGNPNYIETIEGTLANPWGENFDDLYTKILNNDVTAFIQIPSVSPYFVPAIAVPYSEEGLNIIAFTSSEINNAAVMAAIAIGYTSTGNFIQANLYVRENGVSPIPDTIPCTITIIHHPMP